MGLLAIKDLLESFYMVGKFLSKCGIAGQAGKGEDIRPGVVCEPVRSRVGETLEDCCASRDQVAPLILVCVCVCVCGLHVDGHPNKKS